MEDKSWIERLRQLEERVTIIEVTLRINAEEAARKVSRKQYKWMVGSIIVTALLGIGTFVRGFFH